MNCIGNLMTLFSLETPVLQFWEVFHFPVSFNSRGCIPRLLLCFSVFFFFNFYLSFLTVLGLRCCVGFWLRWLLLLWSMALGHVDLSSCRRGAQQPRLPARSTGSIAAVHGLSCSWQVGSSQVRNGTRISCTGRQILCYWATREALLWFPNLLPPVLQLFIFLNEKTNIYWYI